MFYSADINLEKQTGEEKETVNKLTLSIYGMSLTDFRVSRNAETSSSQQRKKETWLINLRRTKQ